MFSPLKRANVETFERKNLNYLFLYKFTCLKVIILLERENIPTFL